MVDEVHNGCKGPILDSPHVDQGVGVRVSRQQVPAHMGEDQSELRQCHLKKMLDEERIILCAAICWPSSQTRVTSE